MDSFEMLSAQEAFTALSSRYDHLNGNLIQGELDGINLFLCRCLTRYKMSDKLRETLLARGRACLLVEPYSFFALNPNTKRILENFGLTVTVQPSSYYWVFKVISTREQLSSVNEASKYMLFSGEAVSKQLDYLLEEPIDPVKDALDLCLYTILEALFNRHNPNVPLYIHFFPNLMECAFPKLRELGWEIFVHENRQDIDLSIPRDLQTTS